MKSKLVLLSTIALFACVACDSPEPKKEDVVIEKSVPFEKKPIIDIDATVAHINEQRASIETKISEITPKEVSTKDLRSQISQKWSKIHFYAVGDEVIRIKTYPHATVSKRTEEFYFENGSLILVVIEDDGAGDKGKTTDKIDRMYYFNDGTVISEINNTPEKERSNRQSDGMHLLGEANEYLAIYTSH